MHEKNKATQEKTADFKTQLNQILQTPLSTETINDYASGAIHKLIALLGEVIAEYQHQPTQSFDSSAALEDAAFYYFGLSGINEILDHVTDIAAEIHSLDSTISQAKQVDEVIVPPGILELVPNNGNTPFEHARLIPKLKSLLFVLANDFDVDVNNPAQLSMIKGPVNENMVRRTSYYLVEIPPIQRKVLICDEENNITYVFDDKILAPAGVTSEQLIKLTKEELNSLLERHKAGQRVVYSKNFLANLVSALKNPQVDPSRTDTAVDLRYLYPDAPQDVLSVIRIARKFEVGSKVIKDAIEALGPELGETQVYRFNTKQATGYTEEQQEKIRQYLETRGMLSPKPPEGVVALSGLMEALDIPTRPVLQKAIDSLGESLGETKLYKFGPRVVAGYNPHQQSLIRQYLEESGYYESAPEGYKTINGVAKELGLAHSVIQQAVEEIGENMGELTIFKSHAGNSYYLSPAQQELVRNYLNEKGLFAPDVPDGYLSILGMAEKYGVDHATITKAIGDLDKALGDVESYRFFSQRARGFSPAQQEVILHHLQERGLISDEAPEGTLSFNRLKEHFGLGGDEILKKAVSFLQQSGQLGEVRSYRFGTRKKPAIGYTVEQQQIIHEYLLKNNLIQNEAPENYRNASEISQNLGVDANHVRIVISELGGSLGEVKSYKSNNRIVPHYDLAQQAAIEERLGTRGFIGTKPPEGYLPISAIANLAGVAQTTAMNAAASLRGILGETKQYRFKTLFTVGYSPEQQQIILNYLQEKLSKRST